MAMGLMLETTTTAGTLMIIPVEYGATLQILAQDGRSALYLHVLSSWEMLVVRMRISEWAILGQQTPP